MTAYEAVIDPFVAERGIRVNTHYFDHSASSPMYPKVIETISDIMKLHYANPAALHRAGSEAAKLVERARASVAERFGAAPQEVVFTSGGTESNNLAIRGTVANAARSSKHVITTGIEHASVYECVKQLGLQGVDVTILPVDSEGRVSPEDVAAAMRKDTVLVSIMHVNNETGAIQPIEEIGRIVAGHAQARFHVDGVQAIGKVPFHWHSSGVHLYSGSAHKIGGPKGVGFLLVQEGIRLAPLLSGGGQEDGIRSGTSNVPGIVGTAQALRLTMEGMARRSAFMYGLRNRLLKAVADIPELVANGIGIEEPVDSLTHRTAPHIVNLSYPGMRPEVLVHMLEKHGILVSTQSACSSKSLMPSRVLLAMGCGEGRATGSIRISFGDEHAEPHIEILAAALRQAVAELKPLERSNR
ncbi:cysteine desulfurase family protein [Cohnella panacarvi]|uniref:cysteine desulfurase family protein n=1 Tax=Cohnella panacarvi TaxID=400776 RepID=UPI0004797549|nr:cysteine desulfurase family protein [Cohnella panacarvi]